MCGVPRIIRPVDPRRGKRKTLSLEVNRCTIRPLFVYVCMHTSDVYLRKKQRT